MQRASFAATRIVPALMAVLAISASAWAAPLLPGGTVAPTATPSPAGAVHIVGSGLVPFTSVDTVSFSGFLNSNVWTNDPSNPFGLNALTFTFELFNNGPDTLERLVTVDYTGYLTDAAFNATGGFAGVVPSSVDRSVNSKVVGWDYTGAPTGVPPLGKSSLLVLFTNATQWVPVTNSVINGSVAVVSSFGPAPIPEPATVSAIGFGLAGLATRRRK